MASNVQYPLTQRDDFMAKKSSTSSSDESELSPDQRRAILRKEIEKEREAELEELKEWRNRLNLKRMANQDTRDSNDRQ
jgi:hypothetical protein